MPVASIDIGSNTIRLLIADVVDGRVRPILYDQEITRLSRGLRQTGNLSGEGRTLTLAAIEAFLHKISELHVSEMVIAGTEALRAAGDARQFLGELEETAGRPVKVLSGEEEALITTLGVCSSLPVSSPIIVLDIGGGSTETTFVRKGTVEHLCSLPVGVVRLLESASPQDPPSPRDIVYMTNESWEAAGYFRSELEPLMTEHTVLVGTAGTPTTAAAIDLRLREYDRNKVHGHILSLETLNEMLDFLAGLTTDKRAEVDGIEPKRADLIIPGIILTIGIMKSLGFHEITVSDQGLLEGLLLDMKGVRTLAF